VNAARRVLVAVDHRRNRQLLEEWLADDRSLQPVDEHAGGADLVVFDGPAFVRRRTWLAQLRSEQAPARLPCLLITPHKEVSLVTRDLWRDVDELITTPIRPAELRLRVERLLELRAESLRTARALEELARSNTDLQQFAFVAAHELSTPLSVVIGVIETVSGRFQGSVPTEVTSLLAAARTSSTRLLHLIDDLLAYSRVGQEAALEPVDLGALVPEALAVLGDAIAAAGAEIPADGLPTVLGDDRQLRLVFTNLVGNAVKYRRPGVPPLVEVSAARDGDHWCISVADNGIGIEPSRAQAMFGMFERERRDGDRPGSGIGLALCKRIVERHGGDIWIERGEAGGTVVKLSLRAA
jgi:signal transduction histidine kinase